MTGGERPARGAISALIEELASAPDRDLEAAWQRGYRPGDVVGRFELGEELGRGGFGVIYDAHDTVLGRHVAFKAIRAGARDRDPAREALLRREAEAIAQLQHPNIVTLHDFGLPESAPPYLILELLRGETLARRLERGRLPARQAVRIAIPVARALVHAHAQGVLHRDLKPGNVFLAEDGGVKVLDFGLAHVFGAGGPAGSGTPGYMAPEQLRKEPEDPRTDVFALGVLLHEMITGRRLFPDRAGDAAFPVARLARPDVSPALADLVQRCLEADPARRPRDAAEVLRALGAVDRALAAGARRRMLVVLAASVAAAAGVAGTLFGYFLRTDARAIAVADVANDAGDADLDGVSAMLASSLERSLRLTIVPRRRLANAAPDAERLVGEAALAAAQAVDARVLLAVGASRRADGAIVVEVRGVSPRGREELFAFREAAAGKARVPDAVDALARRVRDAFDDRDRRGDSQAPTRDVEAYHEYFLGEQCAARPIYGQDCGVHFRRAVEKDPAFALAWYQLATWRYWYGGARDEYQAAIRRAAEHAERVPERVRMLIHASEAFLGGDEEAALERLREVTERWPDDKDGWYQLGEVLRRRDELAAAIPVFERAVALDPKLGWAYGYLAESLGAAGRNDDLRARVREWEKDPRPATLHALSIAYGWLGDVRGAAEAATRGVSLGAGLQAQEDLLSAVIFSGDYASAEPGVRALAAPHSEVRPLGYYALAALDAYQGRRRAGLEKLDELRREFPAMEHDALYRTIRIDYLLGDGDAAAVWRELEALRAIDPATASEHAAGLAWLGDLEHAAELARGLRPGSVLARTYEAVAAWRRGDAAGALEKLEALSRETPMTAWRVAPLYLYGDIAAREGRDAEAVAALRRFQAMYVPRVMWRSWAQPRSVLLLARSQERLGERRKARELVDALLGQLARAEPRDPVAAEARALRSRIVAAERERWTPAPASSDAARGAPELAPSGR